AFQLISRIRPPVAKITSTRLSAYAVPNIPRALISAPPTKQGTPSTGVGQSAHDRPPDQGRHDEGSEREPRARLVRTSRSGGPERQGADRDEGCGEVRDVSKRQPDECGGK